MIHPLAQADPVITSLLKLVMTGGGTAMLAGGFYLLMTGKLVRGAELEKAEKRHKEEVRDLQERLAKWEKMTLELLTTNRELTHAAGRATEVAEKVTTHKPRAGAIHDEH